jgi:hypothetical protein
MNTCLAALWEKTNVLTHLIEPHQQPPGSVLALREQTDVVYIAKEAEVCVLHIKIIEIRLAANYVPDARSGGT